MSTLFGSTPDSGVGSATPSSSFLTPARAGSLPPPPPSTEDDFFDRLRGQLNDTASTIGAAASSFGDTVRSGVSDAVGQAQASARNVQSELDRATAGLPTLNATGSQMETLLSGASIWSKMLFLAAVLVAFLVMVSIGTAIISSLTAYQKDPKLLNNLKPGTEPVVIPQDPATAGSIPLLRSKNEGAGVEFTYSTWIFVNDVARPQSLPSPAKYKHVFHKGAAGDFTKDGMSQPVNTPGLYISSEATDGGKQKVDLVVVMSTFEDPMETIVIKDVPLNKWINVIIVLKGQVLDVYINGTIAGRHTLKGVPMQSYGPLNMSLNGGFAGRMSTTQYFSRALSPVQIANVASVHPSLQEKGGSQENLFPPYLSLRWYTGSAAI
jgi:hypothetical protein